MEFPILLKLPLPNICRREVTWFLREPHPTAKLINTLVFERRDAGVRPLLGKPKLLISGPGVRSKCKCCLKWPKVTWNKFDIPDLTGPRWIYLYDEVTGESW